MIFNETALGKSEDGQTELVKLIVAIWNYLAKAPTNVLAIPHTGLKLNMPKKRNTYMLDSRLRFKCNGKRAETRFRLSAKRAGPFKSAGASVHSTTGSRVVRISGSNAG